MSRRTFDRYMCSPDSPQPNHLSRRLVLFKRAELDAFFSNKQSGGSTVMEAANAE